MPLILQNRVWKNSTQVMTIAMTLPAQYPIFKVWINQISKCCSDKSKIGIKSRLHQAFFCNVSVSEIICFSTPTPALHLTATLRQGDLTLDKWLFHSDFFCYSWILTPVNKSWPTTCFRFNTFFVCIFNYVRIIYWGCFLFVCIQVF